MMLYRVYDASPILIQKKKKKKKEYSDTQEIIMRFLRYAAFLILRNQSVVKNERNSLELDTGDQDVLE